jgi:branched-chain amino acid transport system substrate-binding protein
LQWGIENAGSVDTQKVREALNKMNIMTFYGRQRINPATGIQIGHGMVVAQWQDGKKVVVGPPDLAVADIVYPVPK